MSHAHGAEGHAGPAVKTYIIVFVVLCICTALSFIAFSIFGRNTTSFAIILTVAVVKAVIVATYFMHLIVDWRKLYYMIIPALILAVIFVLVLLPDIVLVWHYPSGGPMP